MIEVPVYNRQGEQVDAMQIDEQIFGGKVRHALLKQAVVMYQANKRQGTAATRSRGMVAGSTRKLYRQKGTGRARMGTIRTNVRRGGGVAFAKTPCDFSKTMPCKARRLARDSAILSKLIDGEVTIVDELSMQQPKTKDFAGVLAALKIDGSCLVGLEQLDQTVYRSARNLPRVDVMPVSDFNAYDVLAHRKLLITRAGMEAILAMAGGAAQRQAPVTA